MRKYTLTLFVLGIGFVAKAQIIALSVGALISAFQPQDVKTLEKMEGDWLVKEWIYKGENRTSEVDGINVRFEECSKIEREFKFCSAQIFFHDGKDIDVLEYVNSDQFNFAIISKKESQVQAETTEGIEPEEVPEEPTFRLNGKDYRYIVSIKKKEMYWKMISLVDDIDNQITFEKLKTKKKKK